MTKKIFSILLVAVMLVTSFTALSVSAFAAESAEDGATLANANGDAAGTEEVPEQLITIKNSKYDAEAGTLTVTLSNKGEAISNAYLIVTQFDNTLVTFDSADYISSSYTSFPAVAIGELGKGKAIDVVFHVTLAGDAEEMPAVSAVLQYAPASGESVEAGMAVEYVEFDNIIIKEEAPSKLDVVVNFLKQTGFSMLAKNWKCIIMILISCVLLYLAIGRGFEPLLLVPIAIGMLLTNLPGAEMFHEALFANGHVHWDLFVASENFTPGLIDYLYLGVKFGIYPCLIFIGVGAMTDFAPLIANPKSLLLGAAAQLGIFMAYGGSLLLNNLPWFSYTCKQAASIGIIGGADGPTAIFVTSKLAPELLGPIAVAAYSYMALVPVIQPPIMKALTTKKERMIKMDTLREVSKKEKIFFPIIVTVFVALLVPSAAPLVGCLMFGNLLKECGVTDRLSKTAQNELMNIVTIFLGISVGATATADTFLAPRTLGIIVLGVIAFSFGTAGGVLLAKLMNLFLPKDKKINPLIGSAGVSAVPMAARVSQVVGQKENPSNFLLMHAMGPNVAGVIGSAIAAGALIALFG